MNAVYARDLDLNLLRVFVVVAETGSVTAAAARLYLTQPAISAALKRLSTAIGAPLFARAGRGLALTTRGQRLLSTARPHLAALAEAAMSPERFDPRTSDRVVTLGLSDASEQWLLPPLLRRLARAAPRMRVVVLPVHFRSVADALVSRVDLAVTVADELPVDIRRQALFGGGFVCVYDPRHATVGRTLTRARYLAHEHVIVSYNGDLRGLVEDLLGVRRNVRVSVASFQSVGAIVEGTAMLATVPGIVAREILRVRRGLRSIALPFPLAGTSTELLWRAALDDDDAVSFVRGHVAAVATEAASHVGDPVARP